MSGKESSREMKSDRDRQRWRERQRGSERGFQQKSKFTPEWGDGQQVSPTVGWGGRNWEPRRNEALNPRNLWGGHVSCRWS